MIVLDASVIVELLTGGGLYDPIMQDLAGRDDAFIAPHLVDVEVMSALRRMAAGARGAGQKIDAHRSEQLLTQLADLPVERYPHTPLLARIWELRHNFTAYDAAYIALAEAVDAVLYTGDQKLAKGHRARVKLFRNS
jgi:predicted nucleic acid-binding protein